MLTFMEMLQTKFDDGKFVCVGLDSDLKRIPKGIGGKTISGQLLAFNQAIIDHTKDLVCAYKPNSAFYERYGVDGIKALENTIRHIKRVAPEVPVILDFKRGDIGNTNLGYVEFAFDILKADAVTIHGYLGQEAMQPFLDRKNKGVIVLCRTSNPGAGEFQDVEMSTWRREGLGSYGGGTWSTSSPLYRWVAHSVAKTWNANGNCCVVAGATASKELEEIRYLVGDMPILIPGIGAQGGDLEAAVRAGKNSRGQGIVINSSRGVIHASSGPKGFANRAARDVVQQMNKDITAALAA